MVSEVTRAIPRSSPASSGVMPSPPARATTSMAPGVCSSVAANAAHDPTPGTSSEQPASPGFTASSSATGAAPRG